MKNSRKKAILLRTNPDLLITMKNRILMLLLGCAALAPAAARAEYGGNAVGDMIEYRANYEDTFVFLARDYNLGFVELRAANPHVDPWLPGEGTKLVLPGRHLLPDAPRSGIVINLPEMRLYAFVNGDKAPLTYPIGIGREGLSTPLGTTEVVRKTEGPIWYPTERMRKEDPKLPEVVPPGPDNPMGAYAMYLGWPTYAIHGTNKPFGIGRRSSSGCIRMYPESIEALFNRIPVNTKVTVVNQPIKLAWIDNELYLEAHPEMEQAFEMEETGVITTHELSDADMARITKAAGKYEDKLRWPAIRTAIKERRGYPIAIARRPAYDRDTDMEQVQEKSAEQEKSSLKKDTKATPKKEAQKAKPSDSQKAQLVDAQSGAGPVRKISVNR